MLERTAADGRESWASWVFRYAHGWKVSASGKRYPAGREMGLGDLSKMSLTEARQMAQRWRSVLLTGNDPIAVCEAEESAKDVARRLAQANAVSFKTCAAGTSPHTAHPRRMRSIGISGIGR